MIRFRTLWLGFAALLAAPLALSGPVSAQTYPTQLVRIVVPFSAGSVTDIMARIIADKLAGSGTSRSSSRTGPACRAPSRSPRHTRRLHPDADLERPHGAGVINKNLTFDPVKDFAGITPVCSAPYVLIVNPELPAKSVKELIALAKSKPGKLNFSSPGLGSTTFIAGALFRKAAGIDVVHVPYKGAPESVTAVVRGDAQMYFAPINLAKELAEAGKVRAIALATPSAIPNMPDTPTFTEAGLPFVYDAWFGLMAPAGVPRDIIAKINKDVVQMLQTPQAKAKLAAQVVLPVTDTPEAFDKIIREETANLTQVFKEAGIGATDVAPARRHHAGHACHGAGEAGLRARHA